MTFQDEYAKRLALIGRAEQADTRHGISSTYACANCCPDSFYDAFSTNCAVPIFPTETTQLIATERDRDCYGTLLDAYEVFPFDWFSFDVGIASVDGGGLAKGESAGNTTIQSSWYVTTWQYQPVFDSCASSLQQVFADALCDVAAGVTLRDIEIKTDTISYTLEPFNESGTIKVELLGSAGSHTIVEGTRSGGEWNDSWQLDNLPTRDFTSVRVSWTVNGRTSRDSRDYHITVLGDYRITCYSTPLETDFSGSSVTAGTATSACAWSSRSFISGFLDEVNENGSGIDSSNTAIQIEGFCTNPPATSPSYDGRRYRRPTTIRTACNNDISTQWTVAVRPQHPHLSCGDPVLIRGIGHKLAQDRGGGLAEAQIDLYRGSGSGVCQGWDNPSRKVIKLY